MFGEPRHDPRPPRYEPLILVLLAFAIAAVLTLGYTGVWYLIERAQQGGP